jgi:hypothetical protein
MRSEISGISAGGKNSTISGETTIMKIKRQMAILEARIADFEKKL